MHFCIKHGKFFCSEIQPSLSIYMRKGSELHIGLSNPRGVLTTFVFE
jgi:hypothetical protein